MNSINPKLLVISTAVVLLAGACGVDTGERYRFAAAGAGFGQLLRGGKYTGTFGYGDVLLLARGARGDDPFGYRGELLQLVNLAVSL